MAKKENQPKLTREQIEARLDKRAEEVHDKVRRIEMRKWTPGTMYLEFNTPGLHGVVNTRKKLSG
ncbi:MAG: hypothetical protein NTY75_04060 [Candidatus Shapirobacteria bacterium]|nr:hypothetical protein [Candidatus Shapirobacteria bacterium]